MSAQFEHLSEEEIATRAIRPERVRTLLTAWRRGEVDGWFVVEQAEAFLDELGGSPDLEPGDARYASLLVVRDLLSLAPHQRLTPEDVPALLAFMNAPSTMTEAAATQLDDYLQQATTTTKRENEVATIFFPSARSDSSG